MRIQFRCTSCGKRIRLESEEAGKRILCPACGASLIAPRFGFSEVEEEQQSEEQPILPPMPVPGLGAQAEPPPQAPASAPLWMTESELPPIRPAHYQSPPRQPIGLVVTVAVCGVLLVVALAIAVVGKLRQRETTAPGAEPAAQRTQAEVATRVNPRATQVEVEPVEPLPTTPQIVSPPPIQVDPPPVIRARFQRPPVRPVALPRQGVTDEQIGAAIQSGVEFILAHFGPDGKLTLLSENPDAYESGLDALCVYALAQAGQAIRDERLNVRGPTMKRMLDQVRDLNMGGACEVYGRAVRTTLLSMFNRPEDRTTIRADVLRLLKIEKNGAYTYTGRPSFIWDNSNSQYGLLGVWSAAEIGIEVPQSYWQAVQRHWAGCQLPSGPWSYNLTEQPRLSMTAAGVASLFVTHDYLEAARFGGAVGRDPFSPSLSRGLKWLEAGDNSVQISNYQPGYVLYSLERAALASGFKYFGQHDWYRELAGELVWRWARQVGMRSLNQSPLSWFGMSRGSRDDLIETSFSLLFLSRGRHPIVMNKVRFDGFWANRPRDVANLARFASRELERPLNWQVVPLDRPWQDWMDSPVLYLASHKPLKLTDAQQENLRHFVEAGGLIFTQADGDDPAFTESVTALGTTLFPQYQWQDAPANHPIYSLNYKVENGPKLRLLGNGARVFMLHSPQDISQHWQLRAEKTKRNVFELGVNLFIYAAGKTDLRNRLSSPYLPEPEYRPSFQVHMARLKHQGHWNPEPHAFVRFSRWFAYQTGYELDVDQVGPEDLSPDRFPIAHMTGVGAYTPAEKDIEAIRKYVDSGGILLIDACGGAQDFAAAAGGMIAAAFPDESLHAIPADHPLLSGTASGMEKLGTPKLRQVSRQQDARPQILSHGKGHIIFTPLDLTAGVLGVNTWTIDGYTPAYAQSLMKNIVLWAADESLAR